MIPIGPAHTLASPPTRAGPIPFPPAAFAC